MHLYCGNGRACKGITATWHQPTFADINGHRLGDCKKGAKRMGWRFVNDDCYCRECGGKPIDTANDGP